MVLGGELQAGIWAGTAESFVNLNALLPPPYTRSNAGCIWTDGTSIVVGGSAFNPQTQASEAVIWRRVVPGVSVVASKRRNRARFTVTNTGNTADTFRLTKVKNFTSARRGRSIPVRRSSSAFRVVYTAGGQRITRAMKAGRATVALGPGASTRVEARISARRRIAFPREFRIRLTARSERDPSIFARTSTRLRLKFPLDN